MKTRISFIVKISQSCYMTGKDGSHIFNTEKQATDEAIEFKNNPKSFNENMSDESVEYWKAQNYTVVKETVTFEELKTI